MLMDAFWLIFRSMFLFFVSMRAALHGSIQNNPSLSYSSLPYPLSETSRFSSSHLRLDFFWLAAPDITILGISPLCDIILNQE